MTKQPTEFDLLSRMFELLSRGWCQHMPAADYRGRFCQAAHREAAAWCVLGAWDRAEQELRAGPSVCERAVVRVQNLIGGHNNIGCWNDSSDRTHAEILGLVQRAASEAREEGEK